MAKKKTPDKMKIVYRKIDDLKPAPYNPRIHLTPKHQEYIEIKESINEYGMLQPLIVSRTRGYVVGGAQRLTVLRDLGWTEVPTVEHTFTNLKREKAVNSALNKITGRWDPDKLAVLKEEGIFESFPTGFSTAEVEAIGRSSELPDNEGTDVDDDVLPQIYQVVVECEDSSHQDQVMTLIKEQGWKARGVVI
jgi:hypothetical protein